LKPILLLLLASLTFTAPLYGQIYRWTDEKGTVHLSDDPSRIPEKFRTNTETRRSPRENPPADEKGKSASGAALSLPVRFPEPKPVEITLLRRNDLLLAEVVLNGRVRRNLIVDTGASFTLINRQTAGELGIVIDENTPVLITASVTDVVLMHLVTLRSVQVGTAEVENVEALVYTTSSVNDGLLGNSFLNRFRVTVDSLQGKMTLLPHQGEPSPDRPGGFGRDYWTGRFRFYHQFLAQLRRLKAQYESKGARVELTRVNNAIRYFENQLGELDLKASHAGVPRNWRE
jgi:clan AA aspartic protease (TIGR02281 family)